MRIPIMNLDSIGIIHDMSPHDLPPAAWSDGKNVTFKDGKALRSEGYRKVFTPPINPEFLIYVPTNSNGAYWYYASNDSIYYTYGNFGAGSGGHFNIGRVDGGGNLVPYNPTGKKHRWMGGLYNNVIVLNNGVDIPQGKSVSGAGFINLTGWPTNSVALSVRGFKNYFVALGAQVGFIDPFRVIWSHPADPGTVPSSWDNTDPTKDAGDAYLTQTPGKLVDQLELRGQNIIYKEDSAFVMSHIGGIDIMGFRPVSLPGILALNCAVGYQTPQGERHFVLGPGEIYTHDGVSAVPVFAQKLRSWVFNNIDPVNYDNSYVVNFQARREIWTCFPTKGVVYPNIAVIWNYETGAISIRDIPNPTHMTVGKTGWDEFAPMQPTFGQKSQTLFMSLMGSAKGIFTFDGATTNNGVRVSSFLERVGLTILGRDDKGAPIEDLEVVKLVTEMWPRFEGIRGTNVDIYVGSSMTPAEGVKWQGPFPFTIGVDEKINPSVSGRLISVRFEMSDVNEWKLNGYDLDIVPVGRY